MRTRRLTHVTMRVPETRGTQTRRSTSIITETARRCHGATGREGAWCSVSTVLESAAKTVREEHYTTHDPRKCDSGESAPGHHGLPVRSPPCAGADGAAFTQEGPQRDECRVRGGSVRGPPCPHPPLSAGLLARRLRRGLVQKHGEGPDALRVSSLSSKGCGQHLTTTGNASRPTAIGKLLLEDDCDPVRLEAAPADVVSNPSVH